MSLKCTVHGGGLDLDVAAGPEGNLFARGQLEDQLLDESRHVMVRTHLAGPLPDVEDLRRDVDAHVVLDLDLAGKAGPFAGLAASDVA
jgi:hypothetical protein